MYKLEGPIAQGVPSLHAGLTSSDPAVDVRDLVSYPDLIVE
jgi:hypothetical protein